MKTRHIILSIIIVSFWLALFLSLVTCSHKIVPVVTQKDSASHSVTITKHDTIVSTVPDSAWYRALIECEKNTAGQYVPIISNQQSGAGKIVHISSSINGNTLTVDCKTDSLKNRITILEKTITDFSSQTKTINVPVNILKLWQKICIYGLAPIGGIVLFIVIVLIGIKLAKFIK